MVITSCPALGSSWTWLPASAPRLPYAIFLSNPVGDCGCRLHLRFGRLEDCIAITIGPGRPGFALVLMVGVLAGYPHGLVLVQAFPDGASFGRQLCDPSGSLV